MDIIQIEKLQELKRYRKRQFLPTLIQYLLSILMLGLFLSSPLWIFKLCYFISFSSSSLLQLRTMISRPKCLFFLCNIIIIFLVGESRFSNNSKEPDIYEEYVKRNESLRKEKEAQVVGDQKKERDEEIEKVVEEEEEEEKKEEEEGECDEDMHRDEDEGLPLEELNRRAEDFIARVNMQRSLEARMLL